MTDQLDRLKAALADRYAIERELGAGGMATVYLAEDLKHHRHVAVKVLRPELAAVLGAERFVQEIATTANLQHPGILALFDSGEADSFLYYVMPYVQGETLRDKLDRETQLGIDEAVKIATEIADALDYAHRNNVIHRDIKPENILLHDGRPVVADFGIAVAVSAAAGGRMTETGLSLGTPHYMSPEQATAEKDLTARSDVYSLGSMLYEMLAGDPPHVGASTQQVIMKIVTETAAPVTNIRKSVPPNVSAAIAKSLDKLPADRFDTASAFGKALNDPHFKGTVVGAARTASTVQGSRRLTTVLTTALAIMTLVAGWGLLKPAPASVEQPPTRLAVVAPGVIGSGSGFARQIALTPDGRTLVYKVSVDGVQQTIRHRLDEVAGEVMTNVPSEATAFAMSQDGRYVFYNLTGYDGYLFPLDGGSVRPLPKDIPGTYNVAWTRDGSLWLSATGDIDRGIALVTSENVLTRPFGTDFVEHVMMQVLPDDRTALTVLRPTGTNTGSAYLLDLVEGEVTKLIDAAISEIRYTSGLLVYVLSDGTMEAVRFDPSSGDVDGTAVQIATGVTLSGTGEVDFAVSDNGTVAYIPSDPGSLILMDRNGESRLAHEEARNYHAPQFSPDGSRIATDFDTIDGRDVWILELAARTLTRVTFDRDGHDAVWEPNGRFLTYTSFGRDGMGIYRILPGGGEPAELLLESPLIGYTGIWLRDGSALVSAGQSLESGSQQDIIMVRNGGTGPVEPLVATRFGEQHPAVSPDNQWIAFNSNQSGRQEIYVRPLEGPGEQVRVSVSGGIEPLWGPDGRELFYRAGSELIVATIDTRVGLTVTDRQALFSVADIASSAPHTNYDISPDGSTFAMVRLKSSSRIMVIQNLPALVRGMDGDQEIGR